jgi:hypothetical protein
LATSSGASARVAVAAGLAAALALLVLAPPVRAAAPTLDAAKAISIAGSDPGVGPLRLEHPGSRWEATFDPRRGEWTVVLEPARSHRVLASFVIEDRTGVVERQRVTPVRAPPRLSARQATVVAGRVARVRDWLSLYRHVTHTTDLGQDRVWIVTYFAGGDEVAEVHVDDFREEPTVVRTGPQVDWQLARGEPQSYGRKINEPWIFLPLSALFLAGLLDWRRLRSLRTLDLLVVLSFGVSLAFFNRGDVFLSTPLVYPPLVYLLVRMLGVGFSQRSRGVSIGERHALVLVALTFALMGFRLGLNNQDSNVIDVGYAGVAGADRLLHGVLPYGHMPGRTGSACGGHYADGDPIGYVQTNGRCESPIETGDTYGPFVYLAYLPWVAAFGWNGRSDSASLPAAHVAASAFDILAVVGLFAAGLRLGSRRLGVMLAFGWAANPFTAYSLNMNSNDALVGAALAWLLVVLPWPALRGAMLAVAGLTKLGPLAIVPSFAALRSRFATFAAFAAMSLALLAMLALDGNGLRLFWDRTMGYQLGRVTPMSIWTLGAFHPGWPHPRLAQHLAQGAVVLGALLFVLLPRRPRDAASIAALAAAALLGTQLVSSYWFYPYVCWWLPALLVALYAPRAGRRGAGEWRLHDEYVTIAPVGSSLERGARLARGRTGVSE